MAGKMAVEGVPKGQAIHEYLAEHADASNDDVVSALKERGIEVNTGLVGLMRSKRGGKPAKPAAPRKAAPARPKAAKRAKKKKKAPRRAAKRAAKGGGGGRGKAADHGNKSAAVRAYFAAHPDASPNDVRDALKAKGIEISASLASAIKYTRKDAPRRGPGRPPGSGGRISRPSAGGRATSIVPDLERLMDAKRLAERLGGIDAARAALDLLARLA